MEKKLADEAAGRTRVRAEAGEKSSLVSSRGKTTGTTIKESSQPEKSKLGSFSRAIKLLDEISAFGPLRFAELEDRLALPKATLHRALNDLLIERLIKFDERGMNYSAGFRLLEIANQIWARSDIRSLARDQLEELCDLCNETVQLSVLADTHIVYIDSVESSNHVRMSMSVGNKVPVYCSGPGKLLLAYCAIDEQNSIIDRLSFGEYTLNTITQREVLLAALKEIREQGYAAEDEEHFAGIRALAAPIMDNAGNAVAALSITAPTFRIKSHQFEQWRQALMQAAENVSRRLAPATRL